MPGYMIRCKKNGVRGWLDDALLFTTDASQAAILPCREAVQTTIRLAEQGHCGATNFCAVSDEFHFRAATRDLPSLENQT
jgi:hypothetical protein